MLKRIKRALTFVFLSINKQNLFTPILTCKKYKSSNKQYIRNNFHKVRRYYTIFILSASKTILQLSTKTAVKHWHEASRMRQTLILTV